MKMQQEQIISSSKTPVNPISLSYVTQRLEKDFYFAIHTLESGETQNVESTGGELVLDVPKLDQIRLNYIKFN